MRNFRASRSISNLKIAPLRLKNSKNDNERRQSISTNRKTNDHKPEFPGLVFGKVEESGVTYFDSGYGGLGMLNLQPYFNRYLNRVRGGPFVYPDKA